MGLTLPGVQKVQAPVLGAVSSVVQVAGVPLEALSVGVLVHVRVGGEAPLVVHAPHALGSRRATSARCPQQARFVGARPVARRGFSRYCVHLVVTHASGQRPNAILPLVVTLLTILVELALCPLVIGTLVQFEHRFVFGKATAVHETRGHSSQALSVAIGAGLMGGETLVTVANGDVRASFQEISRNQGVVINAGFQSHFLRSKTFVVGPYAR